MCGIVGLFGSCLDEDHLAAMNAIQVHRGPDDSGTMVDAVAGAGLAMRRLAIVDLADGTQPMSTPDGGLTLVHNGEIYNAPELRAELEATGVRFETDHSDTEVLLHLYDRYGPAMMERLNGMFAFLLLDRERGRVFGARDRLGIKPLHYTAAPDGGYAFASELKSLLRLPWFEPVIDPSSLYHFLSLLHVPGPGTILEGVHRVPPGHTVHLDLDSGDLTLRPYWHLPIGRHGTEPSGGWARSVRTGLRAAVDRWTLADVPIGISLSGGIDSSCLVGLLAEAGHEDLRTYSVGFTGEGMEAYDELDLAHLVADRYGTTHRQIRLDARRVLDDLPQMVWALDEPYAGGLPSWYVYEFMAREVKVALTGTGGDELFGNYNKAVPLARGKLARLGRLVRKATGPIEGAPEHVPGIGPLLDRVAPDLADASRDQVDRLPAMLARPISSYFHDRNYYMTDEEKAQVATHVPDRPTGLWFEDLYDEAPTRDPWDAIAHMDIRTQLPDEFLLVTDRFSMAHSIEARVPFLDHELVTSVLAIPPQVRNPPGTYKGLLREAVRDLLPPELLTAPKRGFILPLREWMAEDLREPVEALLSPARLKAQGLLRPTFHDRYVKPVVEGRSTRHHPAWAAFMFQLWYETYLGTEDPDGPPKWEALYA